MKERLLSALIYLLTSALGVFAYIYPLMNTQKGGFSNTQRSNELPLLMAVLLGLCILVFIFEIQETRLNTKLIALLGVLIAINSVVRFIDLALPILGGFSPVFFLIILVGYVFGGRIGFLMGAMTLLVSAFITGGVGPWLPNQMFAAGWVGMSAFLLRRINIWLHADQKKLELLLLAVFGGIWGFLYGAITNLWFWPFLVGPGNQSFVPGGGLISSLQSYGVYYLATSLIWDAGRAAGNFVLILFLGRAVINILRRFQRRFHFDYISGSEGQV